MQSNINLLSYFPRSLISQRPDSVQLSIRHSNSLEQRQNHNRQMDVTLGVPNYFMAACECGSNFQSIKLTVKTIDKWAIPRVSNKSCLPGCWFPWWNPPRTYCLQRITACYVLIGFSYLPFLLWSNLLKISLKAFLLALSFRFFFMAINAILIWVLLNETEKFYFAIWSLDQKTQVVTVQNIFQ